MIVKYGFNIRWLTKLMLLLLLVACGRRGALVLPEETESLGQKSVIENVSEKNSETSKPDVALPVAKPEEKN